MAAHDSSVAPRPRARYLYAAMFDPDPSTLLRALASLPAFAGLTPADLTALPRKGLAHRHWRIGATGAVLRVPIRRPADTDPAALLARQAAAFARAQPSGHLPRLIAVVPPSGDLPFGALIVEAIDGRPPRLPDDAPALADALAAIHGLMLPAPSARPPLPDAADSFAATLAQIETMMADGGGASLAPDAARQIDEEHVWARSFATAVRVPPPKSLILTDTHAGNFLVRDDGRAVFVDLEKAQYGCAAIDLAHTTLRPSARWDRDSGHVWRPAETAAFVVRYLDRAGPERAAALQPWLLPFRRLVWLRTTTMYWRRLSRADFTAALAPEIAAHVRAVIADALAPDTIAATRAEWLDATAS